MTGSELKEQKVKNWATVILHYLDLTVFLKLGKAIAKATGFTIDLVCLQKGEELTAVTDADDLVQLKRGGMGEATVTLESNMKGTAVDEKVYE